MKIAIINPRTDFSPELQKKLKFLGEVIYTKSRDELPLSELLKVSKGADILGVDPDALGGFEKAKPVLTKIMDSLPNLKGVKMKSQDEILKESNAISISVSHEEKNKGLIGKEELEKLKKGLIIVNLADRDIVDEAAMAEALKSGKVIAYAFEYENLEGSPLKNIENAVGLKGFAWYTKEAMQKHFRIFVDNVLAMSKGKLKNRVV